MLIAVSGAAAAASPRGAPARLRRARQRPRGAARVRRGAACICRVGANVAREWRERYAFPCCLPLLLLLIAGCPWTGGRFHVGGASRRDLRLRLRSHRALRLDAFTAAGRPVERSATQDVDHGLREPLDRNDRAAAPLARDQGADLHELAPIALDEPVEARSGLEKWTGVAVEPVANARVVGQIGPPADVRCPSLKTPRCATTATRGIFAMRCYRAAIARQRKSVSERSLSTGFLTYAGGLRFRSRNCRARSTLISSRFFGSSTTRLCRQDR